MTNGHHIPYDDLALHAMQALSREESALVRAHVEDCAECRTALGEAAGDLALVAMSVERHELPAGARERLMQRIVAEKPQTRSVQRDAVVPIERGRRRATSGWIPWAMAAALALCAMGLELEVRSLRQQVRVQASLLDAQTKANAKAHMVMDLMSSPHAQHVMLTPWANHHEPMGRAVYMPSKGALIMQASNLAPAPQGKMYELWIIPMEGAPMPAGMFKPDATGVASVVLPKIPWNVQAKGFGVTLEDEQGSAKPTMPILLSGATGSAGE
jgi:anti-sigma-K factor RskA